MNTSQAIREQIAAIVPGTPFTPAYFAGLGSRASIYQTLMRLAQEQRIERISRGIYTVPKVSRFGLKQMPSPESVAQTVAAAEGATIEVHGAEAARRFGFSTQVPAQPVFYTTGRPIVCRWAKWKFAFSTLPREKWSWQVAPQARP